MKPVHPVEENTETTTRRHRFAAPIAILATLALGAGGSVLIFRNGGGDTLASTDEVETTAAATTPGSDPGGVSADETTAVFVDSVASTVPPPVTPAPTRAPTTRVTTTAPPTSSTPTSSTMVIDTLPEQPAEPIRPPIDPRGHEEQIRLGAIRIPKIGVDAPLLEGIRLTTLDNGPGHWPGTAMPGEVGNVVVAGHRTSHGATFRNIDQLVAGDIVEFETATGVTTYSVTNTMVVNPDDVWIVDPTDTPTATLFACHPPGSVSHRIVVQLELVG